MDAADIKNQLSQEAFLDQHETKVGFRISTFTIQDSQIGYCVSEIMGKHKSYGTIRKFSSFENAEMHYQGLIDSKFLLKPEGVIDCDKDGYMVRYSGVFETLDHWLSNFTLKNRSDNDIDKLCSKLGPLLAFRYGETDSLGLVTQQIVIRDDGEVFLWDWAPNLDMEMFAGLRFLIGELEKLAVDKFRFTMFISFISTYVIRQAIPPRKGLVMLVFYHPIFMSGQQKVKLVEILHKITVDGRTRLRGALLGQLVLFDHVWQANVLSCADPALITVMTSVTYGPRGCELPRFAYNATKHYQKHAISLGSPEYSQVQVVEFLNDFIAKNFLEMCFQDLYSSLKAFFNQPNPVPVVYDPGRIFRMLAFEDGVPC